MSENFPVKSDEERKIFNKMIKPTYRDSTKEERAAIAPDDEIATANKEFLVSAKAPE